MLRRTLILAALLAVSPAAADEKESKGGKEKVGQYIDLAPVALPIVVAGRLINYVFVYVRIVLVSTADVQKLRAKEPFFRDALVRAGYRTPFTNPNDYITIDSAKLQAAMMRESALIADARDIKAVAVLSQTPKQRMGLPSPQSLNRGAEIHP